MRFPEFTGEWQKYSLGEIGETIIGLTYKPSDVVENNGTIVFRSSNIKNGEIDYSDLVRVNKPIKDRIITTENDILVCARNGSQRLIGKNAIIKKEDANNTFGAFMMVYRSNENSFIRPLLSTKRYFSQVGENLGARINQITTSDFNGFEFYFPDNHIERTKIAKLFRLIDERIVSQNKIIEDLKKLKSAISKHLFARKDLLETTICLSNIATLKNGYAFQSGKYNALGKWKILTITNVSGERYINDEYCNCIINLPNDIQDHQVLKEGDILISLTGNVGRVSLCKNGDYLLNQRVGLLQLAKNVNQEFLYQILSSQRFENSMIACGQGAAQMNIGKGDVESYVLPYSSNGNNILWVAKILHSYDECIINELRRLTLLTMQKQYLLTQMFI
ncbi:restriction endonuclease subunit S [Alistipes finegoldii]|uniref:restriction endonuclease subunit S n=1 Tax=Alistipes finegoldii TaxID=214856 RepID=UPI001D0970A4|nr:restriction endonuclease subunit S [Alistipes finegoldii]MCB6684082.1 restriction endonuclease subunit S [Alistipes finegoldii]